MAILKALEYVQQTERREKTALVYTDSRVTLQLLKKPQTTYSYNRPNKEQGDGHGRDEWKVEFSSVKAHAGQRGNELAGSTGKGSI